MKKSRTNSISVYNISPSQLYALTGTALCYLRNCILEQWEAEYFAAAIYNTPNNTVSDISLVLYLLPRLHHCTQSTSASTMYGHYILSDLWQRGCRCWEMKLSLYENQVSSSLCVKTQWLQYLPTVTTFNIWQCTYVCIMALSQLTTDVGPTKLCTCITFPCVKVPTKKMTYYVTLSHPYDCAQNIIREYNEWQMNE